MSVTPIILCLVNPASAAGRTGRAVAAIADELRRRFGAGAELHVTSGPGDAERRCAGTEFAEGSRVIVAGGDGTVQEAVNGLLARPPAERHRVALGVLSSGTGQGFAQSIGLPKGLREQFDVLTGGRITRIDAGYVRYRDVHGAERSRYFVNECQAGIGGVVVERTERGAKLLGGRLTYAVRAIAAAATHPNLPVLISVDEHPYVCMNVFGVVVGNGAYTGGGMNLTPGASPTDGLFHLLVMKAQDVPQRLVSFSRIYSGRHVSSPLFAYMTARTLDIRSSDALLVGADGEPLGTTPLRVDLQRSVLQTLTPGGIR